MGQGLCVGDRPAPPRGRPPGPRLGPWGPATRTFGVMSITEADVLEAVRPVQDPELHRSIVELDMVRNISIDGPTVGILVALTIPGCPLKNEINRRVTDAVTALDGIDDVAIEFTSMTDEERATLREKLHGDPGATAGTHQGHGHAEGREIPFADPSSRTRVLLIASGKGGVGKSSVTANLSIALAQQGKRVAVVDADVWGFSIPRMLGVDRPAGAHRPDDRSTRGLRRDLHLDGLLRRGGAARHLARPDAPQGARAVPDRRVLG